MRTTELGFRYRADAVLSDLTFDLGSGVIGLVGVNGAGKSTLLRLLAMTAMPSEGRLLLFDHDVVRDAHRLRCRVGYMPQDLELPGGLPVRDFLAYMAWLAGIARKQRPDAVARVLELVDLEARARDRIGQLSGGMRRRLLLAQALLGEPELLLLDEPTAGLDPAQRIRVRELIGTAAGTVRTTVVSSHLIEDLVPVADRLLMLDEGRVVFDGPLGEMEDRGRGLVGADSGLSPYEAAFLSLCSRSETR